MRCAKLAPMEAKPRQAKATRAKSDTDHWYHEPKKLYPVLITTISAIGLAAAWLNGFIGNVEGVKKALFEGKPQPPLADLAFRGDLRTFSGDQFVTVTGVVDNRNGGAAKKCVVHLQAVSAAPGKPFLEFFSWNQVGPIPRRNLREYMIDYSTKPAIFKAYPNLAPLQANPSNLVNYIAFDVSAGVRSFKFEAQFVAVSLSFFRNKYATAGQVWLSCDGFVGDYVPVELLG
jgi:hypothetical protein